MKKTLLIALSLVLSLSACNTIQGMGQDIETAGESISDGASKAKRKISE